MRKLIRCGSVACGRTCWRTRLAGTGAAPDGWLGWNTQDSDPDAGTYHDASPAWHSGGTAHLPGRDQRLETRDTFQFAAGC
jgi:hypothetical protein